MADYEIPSNEMLLKRVKYGAASKGKNFSFAEQVMRDRAWLPSPSQYLTHTDWAKEYKYKKSDLCKSPRNTIADEIMRRNKRKENTSPGPAAYQD